MKRFVLFALALFTALSLISASAQGYPRPGDTPPPVREFQVIMASAFIFASPEYAAQAHILNAEDSGALARYTLTIASDEIARVAGIDLGAVYGHDIALFTSETLAPGEALDTISLDALPNGNALTEGLYNAIMRITIYDAVTRAPLTKDIHVQTTVRVMAHRARARASTSGEIDMHIHNSSDAPARFYLIASAEASGGAHSYAVLGATDALPAYSSADAPMRLAAPLSGVCEAYLVRVPEYDDLPMYATALVELTIPSDVHVTEAPPIPRADILALTQAIVDCDYLLSLR